MKRTMTLLLAAAAAGSIAAPLMHAQGCVVARSNGEAGGPEGEGGYLMAGDLELNTGYRHQFSFRHYIGDVEQTQRIAQGTEVENKINLENIDLTYQMTPRFAVSANIPVLSASRHSNNSAAMQFSHGIGDTSYMVSGWLWNPNENSRGNIQIAFGLQLPTGNDRVISYPDSRNGKGPVATYDDYSIQPGSGGYGIILQWTSFKNIKATQVYFNGSYLATPQEQNNYLRSATANPTSPTAYNSISDQYLVETGLAVPVRKIRGLTLTLGPRWEGVPAKDLIGGNLGFRRPGYAVSIEPGFQYFYKSHAITFSLAKALYRNRTVSYPDSLTGGHGDAAFADYVWLASYSFRLNNPFHRNSTVASTSAHHS
ncbi:MAG TPA: hypothetical protein VHC90_08975 [Bryobacteraceae bacterium]|nr:hypothetical protein [Bryobacteraceae bacterium]